jgi:N6-adenosine-specific RNA methylase IME4
MLDDSALADLAADVKANGLREPAWRIWVDDLGNGTRKPLILDGRNRLRACEIARIKPTFRDYEGDDPVGFVVSLNLHRRHLDESQRAMVAARVAKLPKGVRSDASIEASTTQTKAAEMLNVGRATVQRAREVLEKGTPDLVHAVERGDIAVSAAAKLVDKAPEEQRDILDRMAAQKADKGTSSAAAAIRQHERDKATTRIKNEPAPLPKGPFRVIVADPPWAYDGREDDGTHRGALTYPTMTTDAICELDIKSIAHDDCVLLLWTTNAFMRDAYRVVTSWGFEEKTILTWKKTQIGLGDWFRNQTEHCIVAVRGCPTVRGESQSTFFEAPRREHSRKPEAFYEIVERCCPGSKVEIFSRETRQGWGSWGAETDKFQGAA